MLLLGALPVYGLNENVNFEAKESLLKQADEYLAENYTPNNFVITGGPVLKLFTSVKILDGPENQTVKIEKLLNRKFVFMSRIFGAYPVYVKGLNFTVEYKRDARTFSRFSFASVNATLIYKNETFENFTGMVNHTNEKHKIKVENFTGMFLFVHARLFKGILVGAHLIFNPAKFVFVGGCDKVTYL